jgi:uncharacterized protein (TIGR00159 family)
MIDLPSTLREIADFSLAALLFLVVTRGVRRSRVGLAVLLVVALAALLTVAKVFDLTTTAWLVQASFTVVALGLLVAFHGEVRHGAEQIVAWASGRRRNAAAPESLAAVIASSMRALATARTGALVVFPGREAVEHYLAGGTALDASPSEALLVSLFESHSPTHDGAVIFAGARVERFGVHLPLSTNRAVLGERGTRHAAALGLAERCDALALVVSEETGQISIAEKSALRVIDAIDLDGFLGKRLLHRHTPADRAWWRRGGWPIDLVFALLMTSLLWIFVAPGVSEMAYVTRIPVRLENVPDGIEVDRTEPAEVRVTLTGSRGALFLTGPESTHVRLDATAAAHGRRRFVIDADDIVHPPEIVVTEVHDSQVRLIVRPSPNRAP